MSGHREKLVQELGKVLATLEQTREELDALRRAAIEEISLDSGSVTQLDIVHELLSSYPDQEFTIGQIATATGIQPASVRMVVYSNKDRFEPRRTSPRRVFWRAKVEEDNLAAAV